MVIWCDSIFLSRPCNTSRFIYLSKHLENTRGSDPSYSHDMKTRLESLTEEGIKLCQEHREQQKTLNTVDNFPEHLCNVNGKQQSYTKSNNMYKSKKIDV